MKSFARNFRASLAAVRAAAPDAKREQGREFITFNGAKIWYRGGNWWSLYGYHYAGKDTDDSMAEINIAKLAGK